MIYRRSGGCPGRQIKPAADVDVLDALPYTREEDEQGAGAGGLGQGGIVGKQAGLAMRSK